MIEASKNGIYLDPDLAQFYDLDNRQRQDFEYCRSLAGSASTILDLGCGTGELAASLANTAQVTAVDPAAAMLDIARKRVDGDQIELIQGDACSVRLDRKFDLILLTGHTFQVFLTEADQLAALATIAVHLSSSGQFIFDSRNPDFPGEKQRDPATNRRRVQHPEFGMIEAWNGSTYDETLQILSYENGYQVEATGEIFSAPAKIRYTSRCGLAEMLAISGLSASRWLGDWQGSEFVAESPEIIPVGKMS